MNAIAQTRDLRPAQLLLAATLLLVVSLSIAHSLSRLDLPGFNANAPALHTLPQAGPEFQAQRPPEPPDGGGPPLDISATPTPASAVASQNLAPLPTALPVATPPDSR
jgi:hypothetical protein